MSENTTQPMPTEFPIWYREFVIEGKTATTGKRWQGISSLLPSINAEAVESFLRIALGGKISAPHEELKRIGKALSDADEYFDPSVSSREIQVLSAVLLALLLKQENGVAARAAIAISTTDLNGHRTWNLPMNLVALGEAATVKIAGLYRKRPDLNSFKINIATVDLAEAKASAAAGEVAVAFDAVGVSLYRSLSEIATKMNKALDATADFMRLQDEELDLLWWVFGEHSDDRQMTFRKLSAEERPLVLAKELSDRTVYLPGPVSIDGLLIRAGVKDDSSISIIDAVNACQVSWLTKLVTGEPPSPLTTPLHFSIHRRLESGDETSWVSGWASVCGIEPRTSLSPLELGRLFYRERLLSIF